MTSTQKYILSVLLDGGSIYNARLNGFRLRDSKGNPVHRFSNVTFEPLKYLLRKERKIPLYVLDRNQVRKLRRNTWLKKEYYARLRKESEQRKAVHESIND